MSNADYGIFDCYTLLSNIIAPRYVSLTHSPNHSYLFWDQNIHALPAGCGFLYYLLDTRLFLRPDHVFWIPQKLQFMPTK